MLHSLTVARTDKDNEDVGARDGSVGTEEDGADHRHSSRLHRNPVAKGVSPHADWRQRHCRRC